MDEPNVITAAKNFRMALTDELNAMEVAPEALHSMSSEELEVFKDAYMDLLAVRRMVDWFIAK